MSQRSARTVGSASNKLKIDDEPKHKVEWVEESENVLLLSSFRRNLNCDLISMAKAAAKTHPTRAATAIVAVAVPV